MVKSDLGLYRLEILGSGDSLGTCRGKTDIDLFYLIHERFFHMKSLGKRPGLYGAKGPHDSNMPAFHYYENSRHQKKQQDKNYRIKNIKFGQLRPHFHNNTSVTRYVLITL